MTLKEILEVTATVLAILVSVTVLYGTFKAVKHGVFSKLHKVLHHHAQKVDAASAAPSRRS